MPEQPTTRDLPTFTVKIDGNDIPDTVEVIAFSVVKEINRIPTAEIKIVDGSPARESFDHSDGDLFVPGLTIELFAGYQSDEELLFKGVIVKHSIQVRQDETTLRLTCKDIAYKTTLSPKNRYFTESTDSDAIDTILSDYSFEGTDVSSTEVTHLELVQFDTSDWAFMLSRAEVNGLVCIPDDGSIAFKSPAMESPVLTLKFGNDILEFDGEIDARTQYEGVKSHAWDPANQEKIEVEGAEPGLTEAGNLSASQLAGDLETGTKELYAGSHYNQQEMQAWADSQLIKSRLSKVRGRVLFKGTAEVKPGNVIELEGVGDRFNGEVYISAVRHNLLAGTWTTDAQFGLSPEWFADKYPISQSPASGLLPAIHGLHIGIVSELEGDPDGEDRIQVKLPIIDPDGEGVWARLACLDAGDSRGTFFRPEIDDEVVVGFFNSDPREPVVLGMLHSSAKPTPEAISNDNHIKGYVSREEMKMLFDDEKLIMTFETPGGNTMIMDEDAGSITIEDQNGNKILMDSGGITMESAADINIKASGDVNIEGVNINVSAQASLKAEGSAGAELSSPATLTIKGSIVQIN